MFGVVPLAGVLQECSSLRSKESLSSVAQHGWLREPYLVDVLAWHTNPSMQRAPPWRHNPGSHLITLCPLETAATTPHRTMAHLLWMGSMILEEVLQASAKRVVEE